MLRAPRHAADATRAEALRLYYRQSTEGLEMQNQCAVIKLRAERRAGEMLAEMEKHQGGRPNQSHDVTSSVATLADLGIEKMQSHRWQRVAGIDEEDFEDYLAETLVQTHHLRLPPNETLARAANRAESPGYRPRRARDSAQP